MTEKLGEKFARDRQRAAVSWWVPYAAAALLIFSVAKVATAGNRNATSRLVLLAPAIASAELRLEGRNLRGMEALEDEFRKRPDLQKTFGSGPGLNLAGLLSWASSDADSGTFRLAQYRVEYLPLIEAVQAANS